MGFSDIIFLLGGIALFLFGMSVMGEGLKKVAGSKLELVLYKLSSSPFKGILLGTAVTAIIQSSSATSVMVVGFVNSGMMKVRQAIGVIMGAILGTSVTGWILCLNSIGYAGNGVVSVLSTTVLTGIAAVVGIVFRMGGKTNTVKYVGEILMGFAVLMYGMTAMSEAVRPLSESEGFAEVLVRFSNPFLGILVGLLLTAVLQSASASVGILQALAVTGAVSFNLALPLLMGIGIGASVPVLLSALGATVNGRRTAFTYLFIDLFGAVVIGIVFYALNAAFGFGFMNHTMSMVSVALLNSLYRMITLLLLSPFIFVIEKLVIKMFPETEDSLAEKQDFDRLEPRFYEHPAIAVEQSKLVINSMAEKTRQDLFAAVDLRSNFDRRKVQEVYKLEETIDRYEDRLGNYLIKLTSAKLSDKQANEVGRFLQVLTDFERISDHSRNIGEADEEIYDKRLTLSDDALREISVLEGAVKMIVDLAVDCFINEKYDEARRIEPLEEIIDELCDEMMQHHVERLQGGRCTLNQGFVFADLLTNYERVADHCSNIGFAIVQSELGDVNAHEYLDALKLTRTESFQRYYNEYKGLFEI